jgi:putative spermidine/putrescine transport system permease protein
MRPAIGLYITMAGLFYSLRLMQTFVGVVIVQLIGTIVYMTWIPAASFAAVPRSLEEAARDSGAGRLRAFFGITLRLASPGIAVAMILTFLAAFDESQATFLVGAPRYVTMPIDMYSVVVHYPEQGASVFALLMTIPSLVLLVLVRRHIMSGHLARGFQLR